jgi:predicted nucleic acid-binding protein
VGSLILPAAGPIAVDSQIIIYSIEHHPTYGNFLQPLWLAIQSGKLPGAASELALMEVLVGPMKGGNGPLAALYERALTQPGFQLEPITQTVLRRAAALRATTRLRTPDAIHAATALVIGCPMFLTNHRGFQKVPGLPVAILDDLMTP